MKSETEQKLIWKKLLTELIEKEINFDLVNNVLSGEFLGDDVKGLWFWFGNIKIACKGKDKAGEMLILNSYEISERDGQPHLYLYTKEVQ